MDMKVDEKEICKYGSKCYQKNPAHRARFQHPEQSPNLKPVKRDEVAPRKKLKLDQESINSHHVSDSSEDEIEDQYGKNTNPSTSKLAEVNIENSIENEDCIFIDRLDGDMKAKLKAFYVVEFPEDIYSFYEFCQSEYSKTPKTALRDVNIELVGPFDLISGDIKSCTRTQIIRHFRYYFDPPEFYTILKSTNSEFHYGYFFDEPDKPPVFVASNNPVEGCTIKIVAANIFGAVNVHINNFLKSCDPFKQMRIKKLQASLAKWAKEKTITLDTTTPSIKNRNSISNSKTFHGAGIVVPFNKKTEIGYRPLAESDNKLRELFKKIAQSESDDKRSVCWSKIQHVITFAEIATDECDFGTSLELGIDMFCQGDECFHKTAEQLMTTAYTLLGRKHFASVIGVHLKNRVKGCNVNFAVSR